MDSHSDTDSKTLSFQNARFLSQLYCGNEENLTRVEKTLKVTLVSRDDWLSIEGAAQNIEKVETLFDLLIEGRNQGLHIKNADFRHLLEGVAKGEAEQFRSLFEPSVVIRTNNRTIVPKTIGQKGYLQAIQENDVVFGIGPAGTGKTYLAMASAVSALIKGDVEKIILTRPAVEAGEALGFLPGDLEEKILPYLRPLYDAMDDMFKGGDVTRLIEKGIIEIAPLAYMRGRTLSNAFIILDEAQNTTPQQMMMFLTRLGDQSKMVITGDITQIDLPRSTKSGLLQSKRVLDNVKGIQFFKFGASDVVRHPLVQRIINAYQRFTKESEDKEVRH
ncbi:MAG: PhoH family protein [Opitutaceae bacterium]|nr:PhoH family protein [Opitutaceae bacterium]